MTTPLDPALLERARQVRLLALDVDGILTDGRLYFDSDGREIKAFHVADGLGLNALRKAGFTLAIITGRASRMVSDRAASLGIEHVYQGQDDKGAALQDLLAQTGLAAAQLAYAGDDWIDLPVLQRVGLAVTVPHAPAEVKAAAHWITTRAGGAGAVRELCELLLDAQALRAATLAPYLA